MAGEDNNLLGWSIDELTSETPEEGAPLELQGLVAPAFLPQPTVSRVLPPPPPQVAKEDHPWTQSEDEAFRLGAFRRSWRGASRREWNTNPIHSDGTMCRVCGFKWHPADIMQDGSCWNCWMLDNKPDEVRRIWARIDSNSSEKHGETAAPVLVKLEPRKV